MSISLNIKNNTLIVHISGEFDLVSANEYRERIDQNMLESNSQNLLLNMEKTTFIDSSGLGVIMGRFRKIKASNGQMVIYGAKPGIKKIFEVSGILSLMPVCNTEEAAWQMLEKKTIKGA
ncbi:MAG: STAS domain-containing protein [Peptococcia bacterium]|jgi:stage II sporulation protein AA (anti-sigma F factor antagonist)